MSFLDVRGVAEPRVYRRDGVDCLRCLARTILVPRTPEEVVRQKTIRVLMDRHGVPVGCIDAELPVPGSRRRADIVVFSGPKPEKHGSGQYGAPAFVIECKEPRVRLDDSHRKQLLHYAVHLGAPLAALTNGDDENYYSVVAGRHQPVIPSTLEYRSLLKGAKLTPVPPPAPWKTVAPGGRMSEQDIRLIRALGILGEDTPDELAPAIGWIADRVFDDSEPQTRCAGVDLVEDGGMRTITFSNAGGGSWWGDYRYFVVRDDARNHQLVSISVMASQKFANHPRFGTRKGVSTLVVAVDDFDRRHNSLQLCLDRHLVLTPGGFRLGHDGSLTLGKRGAAKRADVLQFVALHAPELIEDGVIKLADIDIHAKGAQNKAQQSDMFDRLIRYALLRDDFRRAASG